MLCGIAKDLTKLGGKTVTKLVTPVRFRGGAEGGCAVCGGGRGVGGGRLRSVCVCVCVWGVRGGRRLPRAGHDAPINQ